jgi:hypothetical protein
MFTPERRKQAPTERPIPAGDIKRNSSGRPLMELEWITVNFFSYYSAPKPLKPASLTQGGLRIRVF